MNWSVHQEFESVTTPHVDALFQTAVQLTQNRSAAEDLIHEVYRHAWKCFRRSHAPTHWRVTLFRILLQQSRRRTAKTDNGLRTALAGVPDDLREIILLIDCQEFSYDEAAVILDVSRDEIVRSVALAREYLMNASGGNKFAAGGLFTGRSEQCLTDSKL
jgi:DNA-directed RNA polymerase specialized sigma24 family protein